MASCASTVPFSTLFSTTDACPASVTSSLLTGRTDSATHMLMLAAERVIDTWCQHLGIDPDEEDPVN